MSDPPGNEQEHSRIAEARAKADELRRTAGERLEVERGRRRSVRTAVTFYERDRTFAGGLLAGGLAFRIFLWLLPFALFLVTLLGYAADSVSKSPNELAHDAGMSAALAASVAQAADTSSHGRFVLLMLGLIFTLWLGRSLVRALKVVSNLAWHLPPSARGSLKESAIVAGVALVVAAIPWLAGVLYAGGLLTDMLAGLIMILTFGAVGLWGMLVLPHREGVPLLWLVPGALLLGVGAEAIRLAVSLYFAGKIERSAGLYGSLGVTIVFLAWLYLVGRLLVAALNLNATIWDAKGPEEAASQSIT